MSHYDSIMTSQKFRLIVAASLIALVILAIVAFNLLSIAHAMVVVYPHGSPTPHILYPHGSASQAVLFPHSNPTPNIFYPHG